MLQLSVSWLTNILVRKAPDNLVDSSAEKKLLLLGKYMHLSPLYFTVPPQPTLPANTLFFFFSSAHNVGLCLLSLCGRFDFVISQSLLSLLMPFLHLARFQWFSFLQSINNKTLGDFSMSGFGSSQASWHISSDSSPLLGATCASQGEKINTYCAVNLITYEGP